MTFFGASLSVCLSLSYHLFLSLFLSLYLSFCLPKGSLSQLAFGPLSPLLDINISVTLAPFPNLSFSATLVLPRVFVSSCVHCSKSAWQPARCL